MDFWFIFALKVLIIASIVSLDIAVLLVFADENYEITAGMILLKYTIEI
jgi:hypothetical protein